MLIFNMQTSDLTEYWTELDFQDGMTYKKKKMNEKTQFSTPVNISDVKIYLYLQLQQT